MSELGRRLRAAAYRHALNVTEEWLYASVDSAFALDGGLMADQSGPLDAEYLTSVRAGIRTLIDMDIQFGGDQLAEIALRLF